VFQVQKKDTGQVYAMKVMRKERIIAKDHGEYVRAERNVLTAVFHPYIVTLRCSFQVIEPSFSVSGSASIVVIYLAQNLVTCCRPAASCT